MAETEAAQRGGRAVCILHAAGGGGEDDEDVVHRAEHPGGHRAEVGGDVDDDELRAVALEAVHHLGDARGFERTRARGERLGHAEQGADAAGMAHHAGVEVCGLGAAQNVVGERRLRDAEADCDGGAAQVEVQQGDVERAHGSVGGEVATARGEDAGDLGGERGATGATVE